VLVEHYAGLFPTWLAPVQVSLITISEKEVDFARDVARQLKTRGVRVEIDDSNDKLGAKIRKAELHKIPYMAVIGGKEKEAGTSASVTRKKAIWANFPSRSSWNSSSGRSIRKLKQEVTLFSKEKKN
jgi:threonyl-tRNA synthetase